MSRIQRSHFELAESMPFFIASSLVASAGKSREKKQVIITVILLKIGLIGDAVSLSGDEGLALY